MLGVDETADAALLLGFGDNLQSQRRLARAFRPVDFDDTALRQTADAKCDVETERASGDRLDVDQLLVGAEAHDRPLAEILVDLRECLLERLLFVHFAPFEHRKV